MQARKSSWRMFCVGLTTVLTIAYLAACGEDNKAEQAGSKGGPTPVNEAAISGTISLDPGLKDKVGKQPLLMIIASTSSEPTKPALVVKRVADASFPYDYKLTAEDITLVGSSFAGKMYVTARIDSAGMVGPPRAGTFEGIYPANPVPVGSAKVDVVINKAY